MRRGISPTFTFLGRAATSARAVSACSAPAARIAESQTAARDLMGVSYASPHTEDSP